MRSQKATNEGEPPKSTVPFPWLYQSNRRAKAEEISVESHGYTLTHDWTQGWLLSEGGDPRGCGKGFPHLRKSPSSTTVNGNVRKKVDRRRGASHGIVLPREPAQPLMLLSGRALLLWSAKPSKFRLKPAGRPTPTRAVGAGPDSGAPREDSNLRRTV